MVVFLPFPLIVLGIVLGLVLLVLGLVRGDRTLSDAGGTVLGVTLFSAAMAFVLYDAATGGEFDRFEPSAGYLATFGLLVFISGIITAFGIHRLAARGIKG